MLLFPNSRVVRRKFSDAVAALKAISRVFFMLAGVLSAQIKQDVQQAITRGLDFLKSQQNKDGGHWVMTEDPALSALVLSALIQNPAGLTRQTP